MLAGAHQREFDLILNIFDMNGTAAGLAAHQGIDHLVGKLGNYFAYPRRRRALATVNGQESLGHRYGNFGGLESHHRPVTTDDFKQRIAFISHVLTLRNRK